MTSARSEILHVRLSPEERERLQLAAEAEYLDLSAWARRAILQAIDKAERRGPQKKGAVKRGDVPRPPRRRT